MINRNHAPLRAPEHGWDTVMHEYAQKTLMGLGGIWVNQLLVMLMMIVNMAAYPLVVKAMEQQGFHAAQNALTKSGLLLLSVALPSMVTLFVMAPQFASLLGSSLRESIPFLPYIAVGAFLNGLRSYHFDLAFQLGRYTIGQLCVAGIAALTNIVLNVIWIPQRGIQGAAWATLAAYAVALVTSIVLGKRVFPVPFHWKGVAQVLAAAFAMLCVWIVLPHADSPVSHMLHAGGGIIAYGGTLALLQVMMPHVHGKPKCSSTRRVQID